MRGFGSALLVASMTFVASPAVAITLHDESIDGDFADAGAAATPLAAVVGANLILGGTGAGDRDYFAVDIPAGSVFSALYVRPGTTVRGAASFIGLQAGATFTVPPDTGTAAGLLGWRLYGTGDVDQDILALMGTASNGASGFTAPLPAGTYAFWVQELGAATTYRFELQVAAVPEPATGALLGLGLGVLGYRLIRRRT